ncbi:MAG: Guanine/hypoxanthine permease PbuO [Verrucomicrobiales bacterium]|nr:Guanine/hypoxanthine permease PbuO [Verrucomicrobiales bacterium]
MMGVIVIEGIIITILVFTGTREQIMTILPPNLKHGIAVGIGVFIAFIGFQQMGWVAKGPEGVFLTHGVFHSKSVAVASLGLLIMVLLLARKTTGTILLGILATTVIAAVADALFPDKTPLTSWPKAIFSMPDFSTFGKADLAAAFKPALAGTIFAFLISDFFDTMGTVIGVAEQGGLLDKKGNLPGLKRILLVDSFGAIWGGLCGASSTTSYIESAAGVSEGGRTGLTAVIVSVLFLIALFLTPLFGVVPAVATAPALVVVGFLMMRMIREIDFSGIEEGIPSFLIVLLVPLTQSISTGIGAGIVSYVFLQTALGKFRRVAIPLYIIAALFVVSFLLG